MGRGSSLVKGYGVLRGVVRTSCVVIVVVWLELVVLVGVMVQLGVVVWNINNNLHLCRLYAFLTGTR